MRKFFSSVWHWVGPLGCIVAVCVVLACVVFVAWGVVGFFSKMATHSPPVIKAGGSAAIVKFEAKFQYKPLIIFDNDLIIMPPEDGSITLRDGTALPDREFARMELQYSGYAEYVVDLDISSETVETNAEGRVVSVRLRRPRCSRDNVKWTHGPNEWRKIEGSDDEWVEWYRDHEAQFVTASLHRNANTDENRKAAEEQTRRMVNALIGGFAVDPKQGVEIKWIDDASP